MSLTSKICLVYLKLMRYLSCKKLSQYILFFLAILIINIGYSFFLIDKIENTNFFQFLYKIKYFNLFEDKFSRIYQIIFNIIFLLLIFTVLLLKRVAIKKYLKRLYNSFKFFGAILQHYFFCILFSIPLFLLIFRYHSFQKMFLFEGDYVAILYLMFFFILSVNIKCKENSIILDESTDEIPINSPNDDILNFKSQIPDIINYILNRPNGTSTTSIGVLGSWGCGKTSFLNLIEYYLKDGKKQKMKEYDKIETISFNVAQFEDVNVLYAHFYNLILIKLEENYVLPIIDKGNFIKSIVETLGKGVNFNKFLNILFSSSDAEKYFKCLSNWLIKMDKKIVILIDDIDRLNPKDEINHVFKLIRVVNANMKNLILIISSDIGVLNKYYLTFIQNGN
jgi:hypothetical protein